MKEFDNTNRGQIWKNDRKEKDTHPDYKGSINIKGVEYWLSGWAKKKDAHPKAPLVSFSAQEKDEAHNQGMDSARQAADPGAAGVTSGGFEDSDLPF